MHRKDPSLGQSAVSFLPLPGSRPLGRFSANQETQPAYAYALRFYIPSRHRRLYQAWTPWPLSPFRFWAWFSRCTIPWPKPYLFSCRRLPPRLSRLGRGQLSSWDNRSALSPGSDRVIPASRFQVRPGTCATLFQRPRGSKRESLLCSQVRPGNREEALSGTKEEGSHFYGLLLVTVSRQCLGKPRFSRFTRKSSVYNFALVQSHARRPTYKVRGPCAVRSV